MGRLRKTRSYGREIEDIEIVKRLEDFRDRLLEHRELIARERSKGRGNNDPKLVQSEGEKLLEDAGVLKPVVRAAVGVRNIPEPALFDLGKGVQ